MKKFILTIAVLSLAFLLFLKFDSDTASVPEASMPDAISPPQISANPNQKAKQDEPPKLPEIFRLTAPDEKKRLKMNTMFSNI